MSSVTNETEAVGKFTGGKQPFTILIEGNIGSGKTTLMQHFEGDDNICLLQEPITKWQNLSNTNLLELMYNEPERWAMPFQSYVTLTMLEAHTTPTTKSVKMMERSLYSATLCFVEHMYKSGVLLPAMYEVLQEWYKFIHKAIDIRVDLIVYLQSTPKLVHERMLERARTEESCVPLAYLEELHKIHEDWLIKRTTTRGPSVPILVLDADLPMDAMLEEYEKIKLKVVAMQYHQQ